MLRSGWKPMLREELFVAKKVPFRNQDGKWDL